MSGPEAIHEEICNHGLFQSHLLFESIHPFEDGNGRIGRAISELAISQSFNRPVILSLSKVIESARNDYYDGLARASRSLEIGPWIEYFSATMLKAQEVSIRSGFVTSSSRS